MSPRGAKRRRGRINVKSCSDFTSPNGRGAVVGESIEPYKCGEGSNKNPQKPRRIADVAVGRFY